ncbi:class E sortase [Salinibacterium xinjiangense]|uniref:Sortase A n=1 Tax=Salinibacterium xinjiangense TaxID=386302 RepID=A0A2C9A0U5_9MICO|nr:class E sortase [Salinibacterium xinjiangense]GGL03777.1 class E sortase [Salinibacterium xinjiangense]SOE72533.1 sortase A [Salinibacterium xinjiangense]
MATVEGRRLNRGHEKQALRLRRRLSVVGVLGELLITAGVVVLLFLGWQVWLGNLLSSNAQSVQAQALSQSWSKGDPPTPEEPAGRPDPGPPVIVAAPKNAVQFANLIVPRLGADYTKPVAEGIDADVLRNGIGHYPGTQIPGDVGNAAFAAHRTGNGSPFFDIEKLQVGDSIYFEMEAGWYRYVVRSLEYVPATGVGVLEPVPQSPDIAATDRILTLTSCNPVFTADERIIVYSLFDTWFPRSGGAPAEIAELSQANGGG